MGQFLIGLSAGILAYYIGGWRLYFLTLVFLLVVLKCSALNKWDDPNLKAFKNTTRISGHLSKKQLKVLQPVQVSNIYPWIIAHPTELYHARPNE